MVGRIEMPRAREAGGPGAAPDSGPDSGTVRVQYWAGARDIAGVEAETFPAGSLPEILAATLTAHPRLFPVLRVCSVFVNGEQVAGAGPRAVTAHAGDPAPGATEPDATEPGATEPGATEPGATEPGATEPGATEPGSNARDRAGAAVEQPAEAPGDHGPEVPAGSIVEILPPFAGG